MPTLQETIRKSGNPLVRDANGVLTQQSNKGIQQLTQQAGLVAPPSTAIGAGMIGAGPDTQKMMGSPAQKKAALSLAPSAPQQDLSTAVRTAQARSQTTGEEQGKLQKSTDMSNLGGLGDRVTDFIDSQRQKLSAAAPEAVQAQTAQTVQGNQINGLPNNITGDALVSVKQLLTQLHANPSDQNLQLQLNQALGYDVKNQLDPAQISSLYESAVDSISRGGAGTVDDKLTTADLINGGKFGYSAEQLSGLLGLPPEQIAQLSVGQLRDTINQVTDREFNQSQTLQDQATSGNLGTAERGLARQAGKEASATGIRASEADMGRLQQSIANADEVAFGGKEYKVDDLLKDETISNIIKDYMESGEGSDIRKQVEASEPGLVKFIQDHQAVLQDATSKLETGAGEFRAIQASNKGLNSQVFGGVGLGPDALAALIPQANSLQASRIDPNTIPILKYAQSQGIQGAQKVATEINNAQDADNTTAAQIAALSEDQVNNLQIGQKGGNWDKLGQYKQYRDMIASTPDTDVTTLVRNRYNDVGSEQDYIQRTTAGAALGTLGLPTGLSSPYVGPSSMRQDLLDGMPETSIADAANGSIPGQPAKQTLGQPQIPSGTTVNGTLFRKVIAGAADGKLDAGDIKDSGLNLEEAIALQGLANQGGKIDKQGALVERQRLTDQNTNEVLQSMGNVPISDRIINLQDKAANDPMHYNVSIVDSQLVTPYVKSQDAALQKGTVALNAQTMAGSVRNPENLGTGGAYTIFQKLVKQAASLGKSPLELMKKAGLAITGRGDDAANYAMLSSLGQLLGVSDHTLSKSELDQIADGTASSSSSSKSGRGTGGANSGSVGSRGGGSSAGAGGGNGGSTA